MKPSLDISICVVLFRAEEGSIRFHHELLASLREHQGFEVLYYDNSPTDGLREPLGFNPDGLPVTYVHDPRNLGFSYANNQLILGSRRTKVLLLNPDVYGFTPELWRFIASLDVAECARFARLLNADGSFQDCVGEPTSLLRPFRPRRAYADLREPEAVGMGIMAFMLAERRVYAHVGLLDCAYPLYAEDMDWCYRAGKMGYPSVFDPRIELTHTGGASASDRWSRNATLLKKYRAEALFVDRHFSGLHWMALRALNAVKQWRARLKR
ncbi:glycosyltransferase family 2 protein [Roseateles sp. L2-2]|uniref:glycosyltransferase family 2 protein n=1 Tax=Roseateles sp. L2-2 TaxID=3422597 RepID=UPI003D35A6A7